MPHRQYISLLYRSNGVL